MAQVPKITLHGLNINISGRSRTPEQDMLMGERGLNFIETLAFYINQYRDEISSNKKYKEYIDYLTPRLKKIKEGAKIDKNFAIGIIREQLPPKYKFLFSDLELPSEISSVTDEQAGRFAAFLNAALEKINKDLELQTENSIKALDEIS